MGRLAPTQEVVPMERWVEWDYPKFQDISEGQRLGDS